MGVELERSAAAPLEDRRLSVVPYRTLIGARGEEAHATAAVGAKGAVKVENPGQKSRPRSAMRPSLGGDGGGGLDAGWL